MFFDSLMSFTEDANRHIGNCMQRYACYAAERFEMYVQFVYQLKEHNYSGPHAFKFTAKFCHFELLFERIGVTDT